MHGNAFKINNGPHTRSMTFRTEKEIDLLLPIKYTFTIKLVSLKLVTITY